MTRVIFTDSVDIMLRLKESLLQSREFYNQDDQFIVSEIIRAIDNGNIPKAVKFYYMLSKKPEIDTKFRKVNIWLRS